jgi:hypothetical protein
MSTQDEIREIVKNRYSNYEPRLFRKIGFIHCHMRMMIGDEKFLEFLKKADKENPRPIYKVPDEIKAMLA